MPNCDCGAAYEPGFVPCAPGCVSHTDDRPEPDAYEMAMAADGVSTR